MVARYTCERRLYLDTRFELDVNVDEDNDSTPISYVDGGITSNQAPVLTEIAVLAVFSRKAN